MRKLLTASAIALAVVAAGNMPADASGHRVPVNVCRSAWQHPTSQAVHQCQRQGWTIEVDYDDLGNLWQVLVIGPRGHVWVDNLGSIETR